MLILTRRIGEAVCIGGDQVQVRILSIKGNNVRVGITAPRSVEVHREEVYEKVKAEHGRGERGPIGGLVTG